MMTEIFRELVKETISKIERLESRSRSRSTKVQISFYHAVETTLIDLWKAIQCIPTRECSINKQGHDKVRACASRGAIAPHGPKRGERSGGASLRYAFSAPIRGERWSE